MNVFDREIRFFSFPKSISVLTPLFFLILRFFPIVAKLMFSSRWFKVCINQGARLSPPPPPPSCVTLLPRPPRSPPPPLTLFFLCLLNNDFATFEEEGSSFSAIPPSPPYPEALFSLAPRNSLLLPFQNPHFPRCISSRIVSQMMLLRATESPFLTYPPELLSRPFYLDQTFSSWHCMPDLRSVDSPIPEM